jgi:hypothetical protein
MLSQYAEGADWWGTPSLSLANIWDFTKSAFDSATIMDAGPANEAVSFIKNYFSKDTLAGQRKRFPALFSIYFSGLDHYAHGEGMGGYSGFFQQITDPQIGDFVKALKGQGEFDNKIFIVVSDHGMTAMPDRSQMTLPIPIKDEAGQVVDWKTWYGDDSCKLNLEKFNTDKVKYPEKANNNLHIWELANLFTQFPSPYPEIELKILAPEEIGKVTKAATSDINKANIIAAFNGPMAHIYIKGNDWKSPPNKTLLDSIVSLFYAVFKNGSSATGTLQKMIEDHFPNLGSSIEAILLRSDLNEQYEVVEEVREDAQGKASVTTGPIGTYLSNHPEYVDAVDRVTRMNNEDRSGDIILIMKSRRGDISQRYSTGYGCKAWHGSLTYSDSYVPLIMAYPGGNKYELEPLIDNTEGCSSDEGCDGNWRVRDLIETSIERQY